MKKSLLITTDFPPQKGGVANYLSNFCDNLPKDKIIVLTQNSTNCHFDGQQAYKIIRDNLYYKYFWPYWLKTYFIAKKIIAKEKIEQIIISHVLPMGYIALLLKLPYVVSLHGYDILAAQKNAWKKYWLIKILNKAKLIIVNSNFTNFKVLNLKIDGTKIVTVYPCPNINPENLNKAEKQIIQRELELFHKKIMISVGRLVPRKGFDKVIEALPDILTQIPNLTYLIIGNGPDLKRLEKLAEKLKVLSNITFIEDVSDNNLPIYYDLADLFIMPARQIGADVEGFGIVYLEANLFGKPVIAGNSGGVAEAVVDKKTGLIINPENVSQISNAILRLFNNPELMNKLGVQGRQRVLTEFRWPIQIEKIKNLL